MLSNDFITKINKIEAIPSIRKEFFGKNKFIALGHRGCGSCKKHEFGLVSCTENTIESFEKAY